MMSKRILSGILGTFAIFAGLSAAGYALQGAGDFTSFPGQFWLDLAGEVIMCLMAFVAFGIGTRFLVFTATRHESRNPISLKLVLCGAGMFFPGFLLSLPLALFCADHVWRNNRQASDMALLICLGGGLTSATACTAWMLKRHKSEHARS
jgi:hypothetical protein